METEKIYPGDALVLLPEVPESSVQAIIADPPYYRVLDEDWDQQWKSPEAYLDWSQEWIAAAMRTLRPDGLFFLFGQLGKREHAFLHLMSLAAKDHQFHDLIIWDRAVGYNERRDSLTPCYEMLLVLRKSDLVKFRKDRVRIPYDPKTIETYLKDNRYKDKEARLHYLQEGKYATNILRVPSLKGNSKEKVGHPSQKPLDLIRKLVLMSTDEGDLVLDPFLGSGTTAYVAQELRRRWIGFEKSLDFVTMARTRIAHAPDSFLDGLL